jgi:hypothetical protein
MKIPLDLLKPMESHKLHWFMSSISTLIPKATYI